MFMVAMALILGLYIGFAAGVFMQRCDTKDRLEADRPLKLGGRSVRSDFYGEKNVPRTGLSVRT
ncbi:MAG: hypothetical protein M3511_00385 [Deinococcota bacterium]|jgi:hypothetical protein|nr:hypothetical protein [Deinococcota bacterium]